MVGALCQGGFAGGGRPLQFDKGHVFHLMEPDVNQELYGVPQYLSALQSAWLNEAATLFRRKYYKNGSHAGFVFYMTTPPPTRRTWTTCAKPCATARGRATIWGQFRKRFLYFLAEASRAPSRPCRCAAASRAAGARSWF